MNRPAENGVTASAALSTGAMKARTEGNSEQPPVEGRRERNPPER
jgi:hypothetical protein